MKKDDRGFWPLLLVMTFFYILPVSSQPLEEELSAEDLEIIENLEMLENLELLQEDVALLDNYEILNELRDDELNENQETGESQNATHISP